MNGEIANSPMQIPVPVPIAVASDLVTQRKFQNNLYLSSFKLQIALINNFMSVCLLFLMNNYLYTEIKIICWFCISKCQYVFAQEIETIIHN